MNVYFIEENRFYPAKDVGQKRQPVSVGDQVHFQFPHDVDTSLGTVTRKYECNGRTVHDLVKVKPGFQWDQVFP